ncbi:hypothetical protein [Bosea sp. 124]|uniref:hypothetical protein n=1 Tax=Bosea sp. 124 TaxID=2135642 RepID=UPI000D37E9AF|nr:hypothetical protein [Bosea sp. 124]PTM42526.1 hypothetical protein C8D03_4116 [Bosea sp. 124]
MSSNDGKSHRQRAFGPLVVVGIGMALAGCLSSGDDERASPSQVVSASITAPSHIGVEKLVGRWGIASFHTEKDRKRTEAQARASCSQPYVITKGPDDGVMMHVADDAKLYELRLKAGPGGRTFLGFEAPAGDPQDREILSATDAMLVMRFVDPDAHRRYGTFIYVRCR